MRALVAVGKHLAALVALPAEKRAEAEKALVVEADQEAGLFAVAEGSPAK